MKQLADILISEHKHKIFSAQFVKKDGSLRNMTAILEHKFRYPYITVYDMHKKSFKQINITTIKYLKIRGKEYGTKCN